MTFLADFPAHARRLNPVRALRVTAALQGGRYRSGAAGSGTRPGERGLSNFSRSAVVARPWQPFTLSLFTLRRPPPPPAYKEGEGNMPTSSPACAKDLIRALFLRSQR